MLRDRLVCGVWSSQLQCRLLAESESTFKKALSLCQAHEAADRDIKDMHTE